MSAPASNPVPSGSDLPENHSCDGLTVSSPRIQTPRFDTTSLLSSSNYTVYEQTSRLEGPRSLASYPGCTVFQQSNLIDRPSSLASNICAQIDRVDWILYGPRFHQYGSFPRLPGTSNIAGGISQSNIYPASSRPVLRRPNMMNMVNSPLRGQSAWCCNLSGEPVDADLHGNITGYLREVVMRNLNEWRPAGIDMSPPDSLLALRDARIQDLRGCMRTLAKSPSGHKILLKKMKVMNAVEVQIVLGELFPHMGDLMVHPFANTVIQKLVDSCNEKQRTRILVSLTADPRLTRICLDQNGSRIICTLLKNLTVNWPKQNFLLAIYPSIIILSKNSNGHKVIEQCLQVFPAGYNKFLFKLLADRFHEIATDKHGCRVLSECIKNVEGEWDNLVVDATVACALPLAQHPYGNYVVQDLLTQQVPQKILNDIHQQFTETYPALSRNKFGSNVVEKCLRVVGGRDFMEIACELLDDDLSLLLSDEYANFVVQTMTVHSKAVDMDIHNMLVDRIRASRPMIERSPYGRKALDNLKNRHNISV